MTERLVVPYPPSANTYWRHVGAKVLISAGGRDYRKAVCNLLARSVPREGRLGVVVELHAPDKRRRDIDNAMKCLLDSLKHAGVYLDDSQIDDLRIIRGEVWRANPCAVVEVRTLGPAETWAVES